MDKTTRNYHFCIYDAFKSMVSRHVGTLDNFRRNSSVSNAEDREAEISVLKQLVGESIKFPRRCRFYETLARSLEENTVSLRSDFKLKCQNLS
jgi:hypothetical protein